MKRKGYISPKVATLENFEEAYWGYSRRKRGRRKVMCFEKNLDTNLQMLLQAYSSSSFKTPPYIQKEVFDPKYRKVYKNEVGTHVIQWASVLPIEKWLMDTLYYRVPSCVPNKGTHYFVRQELAEAQNCSQDEIRYFAQLDIHHYFQNIHHGLMKERIRLKIKDPILLHFLDEFIDSYPTGLVPGVKISQLLSGLFLAPFDRLVLDCFGIAKDVEKFHYWQKRYVTDVICTCRTPDEARELGRGVAYLNAKFERYVTEGVRHYSRFADNIVIKHRDKAFLHILVKLAIMTLTRDNYLTVNKSWNVRPYTEGNDLCGYIFYHDHVMLRKRNKKALCRQVAKLRTKGYSDKLIRHLCASRMGFAQHADTKHLFKTLNIMEKRLGSVIKNRRHHIPFEGMRYEQKKSLEEVICYERDNEEDKLILLLDYQIEDSVIEKNEDGTPKLRIALKYKLIDHVENADSEEPIYYWKDEEYYSYSGSKVMIDQAKIDFTKEDLPSPTVIKEFVNRLKKKFYKFT